MQNREIKTSNLHWIDLIDPSTSDLQAICERFSIPKDYLASSMDPEHLPKYEPLDGGHFIILRSFDEASTQKNDSVQGITRKLVIYFKENLIITIHRKKQKYIDDIFDLWNTKHDNLKSETIALDLLKGAIKTYEPEVLSCYQKFEAYEAEAFSSEKKVRLKPNYFLKRRASIINRILKLTQLMTKELSSSSHNKQINRSTVDLLQKLIFQLDEIQSKLTDLLNLQLSLASQRTNEASHKINEVMRVLTIFSVFFMPLNFISSVYGMNFENMPELKWVLGYPFALSLMATVAIALFIWFWRKGWLK